ncbi:hypothetical protein CDD83_7839 [Cordyceps sp. RAO-2017]|nr:hypothetical protein CDD83_7839 [Cordyceps sp. RAO-2017]
MSPFSTSKQPTTMARSTPSEWRQPKRDLEWETGEECGRRTDGRDGGEHNRHDHNRIQRSCRDTNQVASHGGADLRSASPGLGGILNRPGAHDQLNDHPRGRGARSSLARPHGPTGCHRGRHRISASSEPTHAAGGQEKQHKETSFQPPGSEDFRPSGRAGRRCSP